MRRRYSYDPKCEELARYFLPNVSIEVVRDLAQEFQNAAEDVIGDWIVEPVVAPNELPWEHKFGRSREREIARELGRDE